MPRRDATQERFFTSLISGHRDATRQVVQELMESDYPAEKIYDRLFWPTLEHIQKLHRADQLTALAFNYATRLLRSLIHNIQPQLEKSRRISKSVLLMCGPEESEEIAAQMTCDLLEAEGFDVYFVGGGVANDEIVNEIGEMKTDILVMFGAVPNTVPTTRLLIDRLHTIGACPNLQIVVGGGVFNRADGLAEEIGADLWAKNPSELVKALAKEPDRRMTSSQRTVGRKRRGKRNAAAA